MPKLLTFTPCEKVIISQDENKPTLVSIFNEWIGEYTASKPTEKGALLPVRWSIFTMWQQEEGDESKEYQLTLKIRSPGGDVWIETALGFQLKQSTHRSTFHINGLPIADPGVWDCELYLNEKEDQLPEVPLAVYGLTIDFKQKTLEPT